jgi:predicted enzyme related to lactoylglutathione lyase
MSGPARAGLFIYANEAERVAQFYEAVARMTRLHAKDELIVLQSPDIQLLVHQIPAEIARDIVITSPPARREGTALKFFFTVPDLDETRLLARNLGGEVFSESWQGPGFMVCNAMDIEGNVFQVRENVA